MRILSDFHTCIDELNLSGHGSYGLGITTGPDSEGRSFHLDFSRGADPPPHRIAVQYVASRLCGGAKVNFWGCRAAEEQTDLRCQAAQHTFNRRPKAALAAPGRAPPSTPSPRGARRWSPS